LLRFLESTSRNLKEIAGCALRKGTIEYTHMSLYTTQNVKCTALPTLLELIVKVHSYFHLAHCLNEISALWSGY